MKELIAGLEQIGPGDVTVNIKDLDLAAFTLQDGNGLKLDGEACDTLCSAIGSRSITSIHSLTLSLNSEWGLDKFAKLGHLLNHSLLPHLTSLSLAMRGGRDEEGGMAGRKKLPPRSLQSMRALFLAIPQEGMVKVEQLQILFAYATDCTSNMIFQALAEVPVIFTRVFTLKIRGIVALEEFNYEVSLAIKAGAFPSRIAVEFEGNFSRSNKQLVCGWSLFLLFRMFGK